MTQLYAIEVDAPPGVGREMRKFITDGITDMKRQKYVRVKFGRNWVYCFHDAEMAMAFKLKYT